MSKAASKAADTFFPGVGSFAKAAGDAALDYVTPDLPAPPDSTNLAQDPEIQKRVTEQVPDREQQRKAAAVAAGVTRSGNDVDLLGSANRRNVRRTLLGSR